MSALTSSQLESISFESDLAGKSILELAQLEAYNISGDSRVLSSTTGVVGNRLWVAKAIEAIVLRILRNEAGVVLDAPTEYTYLLANTVGGAGAVLLWTTKSVSPVPILIEQISAYKNGVYLTRNTGYTISSSALTLSEDNEISGTDYIVLKIYSFSQFSHRRTYPYLYSSGTGSGNRVFTLSDLGLDREDKNITTYPASASRIDVMKNGVLQSVTNGDYSVTGTGSSMVITFSSDLDSSGNGDEIVFEIWDA